MTARPLRERLLSRLIINPETGCLQWTGHVMANGYGQVGTTAAKAQLVHRVMWDLFNGPVPDGMHLDHLCRNRRCASMAHLEPVTNRVNILRGEGPSAVNARKTHCPAGHEYDLVNTYYRPNGSRVCRQCRRDGKRRSALLEALGLNTEAAGPPSPAATEQTPRTNERPAGDANPRKLRALHG